MEKKATFNKSAATTDYLAAMYHFQNFYNSYHAALTAFAGEEHAEKVCQKEMLPLRQKLEAGLLDSIYTDIEG